MSDSGGDPEWLLSSALRAQASGNADPAPTGVGPSAPDSGSELPVLRVLLFASVLGLVAGGIVGVLSVL